MRQLVIIVIIALLPILLSCNIVKGKQNERILIAHGDQEYIELGMPCCYLNTSGDTIIPFGKYRYAWSDTIKSMGIVLDKSGYIGINNKGKRLFGIVTFDNGPDYVKEGLFRITDDGKTGFADTLGNVVIPIQYQDAFPFENGLALVSRQRKLNSEDHAEWLYIDHKGKTRLSCLTLYKDRLISDINISVFGRKGNIIQVIPYHFEKPESYFPDIKFLDVNFDGQKDMLIRLRTLGKYDCFLWDKSKKKYIRETSFKKIPHPQINRQQKCIYSNRYISATERIFEKYEYKNGKFSVTASLTRKTDNNRNSGSYTERKLTNGKMDITKENLSKKDIEREWTDVIPHSF